MTPQDSGYLALQNLALKVIELFAQKSTKTQPLIDEVVILAECNNTLVSRALLKIIIGEISKDVLLDINLIKGLKKALINSLIDALDPDDLIQVLNVVMDRIKKIHQQDSTNNMLQEALSTLSDILDAMGDSNVIKVGRLNLHEPLYTILDTLSKDDEILIAAQAAYAKQALVRVPNDESKWRSMIRHGQVLMQGFASLYKILSEKDLSSLLTAYDNFKMAVDFQERKLDWYGDIRILKLLAEKNLFKTFSNVIEMQIKETSNPLLVSNILIILLELARDHIDLETKKWALDFISDLFLNDSRWGNKKNVKKKILSKLIDCASLPDEETAAYAKTILVSLENQAKTPQQKSLLKADLPDDLKEIKATELHYTQEVSTSLIVEAQRSDVLLLHQKIEQMKEQTIKNQAVTKELEIYIPVNAYADFFDSYEQKFDLNQAIKAFINGYQKVFLLLGEAGAGKSTYLRYLENDLWQRWESTKIIPLLIHLPSLKNPYQDAIKEFFSKQGFTEHEQKELKNNYSFLFLLDGYDELKEMNNLYVSNELQEWNAKVIITCRTSYLIGEQSSYHNYFLPRRENLISAVSMEEAMIAPFTLSQIESYSCKWIAMNKNPQTWEQYKADINSIPVLNELIKIPSLLPIILQLLPNIIQKHGRNIDQEKLASCQKDLLDALTAYWFEKEEQRLIYARVWNEKTDIKKSFAYFAKQLTQEMIKEGVTQIDYEDNTDLFNPKKSKWEPFFTFDPAKEMIPHLSIIRSGVLLRKVGPSSYAFFHPLLIEYFGFSPALKDQLVLFLQKINSSSSNSADSVFTRYESKNDDANLTVSKPQQEVKENSLGYFSYENLNKKLLKTESELKDLIEEVSQNPNLEKLLFDFIERSKTNSKASIAAANAMTILNGAGVNLSFRDFSHVNICGANLSQAIITNTNFLHAKLRKVQFNEACLDYSNFAFSEHNGSEFGQTPLMHFPSIVNCMAISLNGRRILFGCEDRHVRLWDLEKFKEIHLFQGHRQEVTCVAISPDGKLGLSGSYRAIRIWDLEKGKERLCLNEVFIKSAVFSPDNRQIVVGGESTGMINIYDCQTGALIRRFNGHLSEVTSLMFSKDGKKLFSASFGGEIWSWDFHIGKGEQCFKARVYGDNLSIFSPDGEWFLSAGNGGRDFLYDSHFDGTITMTEFETGSNLFTFKGHHESISSLAFSPDGKRALSGSGTEYSKSRDNTVLLLDCDKGTELHLHGHHAGITSVAFSPDGKKAFSASKDKTVRIWNLPGRENVKLKTLNSIGVIQDISLSADGKTALYIKLFNKTLHLLDLHTGMKSDQFITENKDISIAVISPDGKQILFSDSYKIKLWDIERNKEIFLFGQEEKITCLAFSSDGKRAVSGGSEKTIRVWQVHSWQQQLCLKGHDDEVTNVAFSFDGTSILSGSRDKTVRLWNTKIDNKFSFKNLFSKQLCKFKFKGHSGAVKCVAFSPDGKKAVSGSADQSIRVWDCLTGKPLLCLEKHSNSVDSVTFSPDGKTILSGSKDQTVRLWNAQTGQELHCFKHGCPVRAKFLPDGKHILFVDELSAIQLWQFFDENNHIKPGLKWTTTKALSANHLNLEGAIGLSESNHRLLLQHGAIDK